VLEGSRSRTAGPVRAQCGRRPLRAERAQRATARSLRRLVQRLVVTSVRPHPASSSAERACQLRPTTRQVCWCSGLLRRALVRAHQLAFALCSDAWFLTPRAAVYGAGLGARQLHPALPPGSGGWPIPSGPSTRAVTASRVDGKARYEGPFCAGWLFWGCLEPFRRRAVTAATTGWLLPMSVLAFENSS